MIIAIPAFQFKLFKIRKIMIPCEPFQICTLNDMNGVLPPLPPHPHVTGTAIYV
jgi:hypothetical protein